MATTSDYLSELVEQKTALANNLVTKGVDASADEKFNTLVPKVLDIPSGGDTMIEDSIIEGTLTEYMNDRITTVGKYAFANKPLKTVVLPEVTVLNNNAFYNCNKLVNITIPNLVTLAQSCFVGCDKIPQIYQTKAETIGATVLWNCTCTSVLFGNAKTIGTNLLLANPNCNTIVLCGDEMCTLSGSLQGSFANEGKYIYVKKDLIEKYKVATNWSAYENQFRAIEDYLEDIVAIFPDFVTDFPQFFESEAA